jgi:hypothetical protein
MFFVSHASATAYALVNKADWTMASVFLGNAFGCSHTHTLLAIRYSLLSTRYRVTEMPHRIELR